VVPLKLLSIIYPTEEPQVFWPVMAAILCVLKSVRNLTHSLEEMMNPYKTFYFFLVLIFDEGVK
jgi:hypothetical protein